MRWQYPGLVHPVSTVFTETAQLDKFSPTLPHNQLRSAPRATALLLAASVLVSVAPFEERTSLDKYHSLGELPIKTGKQRQDGSVLPPFIPVSGETITSDKWQADIDRPVRSIRRLPDIRGVVTFALTAPVVLPDRWQPLANQPYLTRKWPVRFGWQAIDPKQLTQKEQSTPDKWLVLITQPRRTQRLIQDTNGNFVVLVSGGEIVTSDKWWRETERPVRTIKRLPEERNVIDQFSLVQAEGVSADKWVQPQSLPKQDLRRWQNIFPVSVSDYLATVPGAEVLRLDKWGKNYPDMIYRIRKANDYTWSTIDPTLIAERSSVDKWNAIWPQPYLVRKAVREGWSILDPLSLSVPIITQDRWGQPQNQPYPYRRLITREGLYLLDVIPRAENIAKWWQATEVPRGKRTPFIPTAISDSLAQLPSGVDRWFSLLIEPRSKPRRVITESVLPAQQVVIKLLDWHQAAVIQSRKLVRDTLLISPLLIIAPPTIILGWDIETNQPIWSRRRIFDLIQSLNLLALHPVQFAVIGRDTYAIIPFEDRQA